MITMIKKIKDVGVFKKYETKDTGITKDFSKLNLIYGLNTYGKSTLCDILKDASANSNERIKQRLSIPEGNSSEVVLKMDGGTACFQNDRWTSHLLDNKIMVFDDEFVFNNIFSGLDLIGDRETKENFTDFVLGDEGVKIAKEITDFKRQQKKIKDEMTLNIPSSHKNMKENEVLKYVNMEVTEPLEALISKKEELEKTQKELKQKIANIEQMKKYSYVHYKPLVKLEDLLSNLEKIDEIWKKSFEISSESAMKYKQLLEKRFFNDKTAEQWLSQGVQYLGNYDTCPFCGQVIEKNNTVEILKDVFADAYNEYKDKILLDLEDVKIEWDVLELSNNILMVKNELNDAKKIFGNELENIEDSLKELYDNTTIEEGRLKKVIVDIKTVLETNNTIKKALPGIPIKIELDINSMFKNYNVLQGEFGQCIKRINNTFCEIRDNTEKEKEIKEDSISKDIEKLTEKITRLEEKEQCDKWNVLYNERKNIESLIHKKEDELENNQNSYLESYFSLIDKIFKKYGARNFEIKKGNISRRGNKDVFGIKVLFNGVSINDKNMPRKFFSESDKRALAMAVFMAKIESMSDDDKKNIILVLDDPITSFDENRMRVATNHILGLYTKMEQTLIFTHHFMFAFYMKHCKKDVNFYQIDKISTANSNGIYDMKANEYLVYGLEKMYTDIEKFNAGQSNNLTGNDLRKFMETYLKCVFSKQYKDNNIEESQFGNQIDTLCSIGVISETVKDTLHKYRTEFNIDSHEYSLGNVEDLRNSSKEMVEYIFNNIKMK